MNNHDFGFLVTIIMPAYNSEKFISDSILSVQKQTYTNWELIVVDDGSSDATNELVSALAKVDERIALVKNEGNKGAAGARNFGLSLSKGDYVAFLDSDDIWEPQKLEFQIEKIINEKADFSFTSYNVIDENGKKTKNTYLIPNKIGFSALLKENYIGCSTVMLSRIIVDKFRFSTDFYHEDYCLWLDLFKHGYKATGLVEPLVNWRLISGSRSYDKKKSALNRWKIYRRFLGVSIFKSSIYFAFYVINGPKKYS